MSTTNLYYDYRDRMQRFIDNNPQLKDAEDLLVFANHVYSEFIDGVYPKFGAIRDKSRAAGGGGVSHGSTYTFTEPMKFGISPLGPTTARVQDPVTIESMDWSIELPSPFNSYQILGIGAKVKLTCTDGSAWGSQKWKSQSIVFERVSSRYNFSTRNSIYVDIGFYKDSGSSPTPVPSPAAGDEGKLFIRFIQGANTDEWRSNVVLLTDATLLGYYQSQIIDLLFRGSVWIVAG